MELVRGFDVGLVVVLVKVGSDMTGIFGRGDRAIVPLPSAAKIRQEERFENHADTDALRPTLVDRHKGGCLQDFVGVPMTSEVAIQLHQQRQMEMRADE